MKIIPTILTNDSDLALKQIEELRTGWMISLLIFLKKGIEFKFGVL